MIKYTIKVLFKRASFNLLLVLGLLALSSGLSTYVSANQNVSVRVSAALNENWRGAHDILVRPQDAIQPTEREHGLVEANYLSVGKSGISVAQWKQIEQLSGIEVAAPVATVGYLRNQQAFLSIEMPPNPDYPKALYKANVVMSSDNGYRKTNLVDTDQYYIVKYPDYPLDPQKPIPLDYKQEQLDLFRTVRSSSSGIDGSYRSYVLEPPPLWTLVAAIDPDAESALLALEQSVISGSYLTRNDGYAVQQVLGLANRRWC